MTGRQQVASVIAVYGPRCTLVVSIANRYSLNGVGHCTILTLIDTNTDCRWEVTNNDINICGSGKVFAPGNLRATLDNTNYQELVHYWLSKQ
mmetsp:Transcript_54866/g.46240  ORF Transcript_54866/g.46240 Transcript_54866/m.46240 type:complete len:92 (+) Transcript_54866:463-738(+)